MSVLVEQEGATRTRSIAIVVELIAAVAIVSPGAARPKAQDFGRDQLPPDVIEITGDSSITAEELARQQELDAEIQEAKDQDEATRDAMREPDQADFEPELYDPEWLKTRHSPPTPPLHLEPPQNENVIPITGDSHGPLDDGDSLPQFRLVGFVAPVKPLIGFITAADGAIEMRTYDAERLSEAVRRRLRRFPLLLVPADDVQSAAIVRRVAARRAGGGHEQRVTLSAYCVDFAKRAPTPGTRFVIASRATRARYAPMRAVRLTAEFAARKGFLRTQGDGAAYGRFVTQYAIWTKLEHWNEARFTDAFLDRTRKSWTASHQRWTSEAERTVRALAPARWRDVAIVINAAARIERRQQSKGTSHVQR